MANQHSSPLRGVERPWAVLVMSGQEELVRELLRPITGIVQRRNILAWLERGAPTAYRDGRADYVSSAAVNAWRHVLLRLGPAPDPTQRQPATSAA